MISGFASTEALQCMALMMTRLDPLQREHPCSIPFSSCAGLPHAWHSVIQVNEDQRYRAGRGWRLMKACILLLLSPLYASSPLAPCTSVFLSRHAWPRTLINEKPLMNRCLFYRNRHKSVRIQIPLRLLLSWFPEDKPSDGVIQPWNLPEVGFFLSYCRKQSWDNERCYFRQCCGTPWIYNLKRIIHSLLLVTDYLGKHWTDQATLHLKKWNIALSKVVSLVQWPHPCSVLHNRGDSYPVELTLFLYLRHTILSPSSVHVCMHA